MLRWPLFTIGICLFVGCARTPESPENAADETATRVLTASDLDRFLATVQSHTEAMIPEFSAPDENSSLDPDAPAGELVAAVREQCRRLFDVERQGALWERDAEWSQAIAEGEISPARFAALVRDVSLAIMRVRLDARVDVDKLVAQARRQVDQTVRTMDDIDQVPVRERTREATALRTRSAIRLGKSVALLEFAELVKKVPPESVSIVRRYSRRLKPLLPASVNEELLVELKNLASGTGGDVQPASYETDEDE